LSRLIGTGLGPACFGMQLASAIICGTHPVWRSAVSRLPLRIEEIPLGDFRLKAFADFPWRLYRGDPCWTAPLRGDLLGNRLLGLVGLLIPQHPYHRHAEVTHFLAWQGAQPVGRIAAAINHLILRPAEFMGAQRYKTWRIYDLALA